MELDYLQSDRMQAIKDKVLNAQSQQEKERLLRVFVREITTKLNDVTIGSIKDGVEVKNLDELEAALHNELNRVQKPLLKILASFQLSSDEQLKVLKSIEQSSEKYFAAEFQPIIIRRPHDMVEVTNLGDLQMPVMPKDFKISNLKDLHSYFESLEDVIKKALNITVAAPQVNVEASKIEGQAPQDLTPILKSIDLNFKKIKDNNKSNPVFVRLTDVNLIVDKLEEMRRGQLTALSGFPNQMYIKGTDGSIVSPAQQEPSTLKAFANISASTTDGALVTAVTGKIVRVVAVSAVAGGTATNLTFNSKPAGSGTAISPLYANGANGGEVLPYNPRGWFDTNVSEGLTATTGGGSTTGILINYILV